jgi:hypothetical protein
MMRFRYVRCLLCQRYGTNGGIKQMGTHNRSEGGRGAWVTLCVHPTHTDTDPNSLQNVKQR